MKRRVTITVDIDPIDYHGAENTAEGAVDVVIACLRGQADFNTTATVYCNDYAGRQVADKKVKLT